MASTHEEVHMRGVLVLAAVALFTTAAAAQQRPAAQYSAPRMPDGQPDLQGFWTNLTYTPFERPKELGDKAFYTEQEAIDAFNKSAQASLTIDQIVHYAQGDFGATPVQGGAVPNRRTSLVIDPPDGRIPPLTAAGEQQLAAQRAARANLIPQTWRDDRGANWCVFHEGIIPFVPDPVGYSSNYQIMQSHDWVVIVYEWNQERRVIPLDGRPHVPSTVRSYAGDSRGRWEGDTLVIETTNWKGSPNPRRNFAGAESGMTLVERLRRVSDNEIDYTFTVTDPRTWTRPWTAALPMHRIKGPMFEYACNENNVDVFNNLKNSRAQEEGRLAAPTPMRRGDSKGEIEQRVEGSRK
jgi:hypothetical protein